MAQRRSPKNDLRIPTERELLDIEIENYNSRKITAWEKMGDFLRNPLSNDTKEGRYWVLGVLIAIFGLFIWPHSNTWGGDGAINAFPVIDNSKNYRLDATMTVTKHSFGWLHLYSSYNYSSIAGAWPDGGTLELSGCVVKDKSRASCTDQSGKSYGIEVEFAPDSPDTSSDSGN